MMSGVNEWRAVGEFTAKKGGDLFELFDADGAV